MTVVGRYLGRKDWFIFFSTVIGGCDRERTFSPGVKISSNNFRSDELNSCFVLASSSSSVRLKLTVTISLNSKKEGTRILFFQHRSIKPIIVSKR